MPLAAGSRAAGADPDIPDVPPAHDLHRGSRATHPPDASAECLPAAAEHEAVWATGRCRRRTVRFAVSLEPGPASTGIVPPEMGVAVVWSLDRPDAQTPATPENFSLFFGTFTPGKKIFQLFQNHPEPRNFSSSIKKFPTYGSCFPIAGRPSSQPGAHLHRRQFLLGCPRTALELSRWRRYRRLLR
jgi:hypothetical protein